MILAPKGQVANKYIIKYLKRYFFVITNDFLCFILYPLTNIKFFNHDISDYCMNIWKTAKQYKIISDTKSIPAFHNLTKSDLIKGYNNLKRYGLNETNWFVTIHARDPHYRNNGKYSIRDSKIESYKELIDYVTNMGGYVFRMGNNKTDPLNINNNKFIDYAHSEIRSDFMDIFLCAKSKLFVGTNSGLNNLPLIFGVPIVYLNLIPLSQLNSQPSSIGVPKLLKNKNDGSFLNFKQCLSHPYGNSFYDETFEKANIEVIDNKPSEILEATIESFERLEGRFKESDEDQVLQKKFSDLLKPGHYGYGTSGKISTVFLRKYKHLL